jgi:hypothetical protein
MVVARHNRSVAFEGFSRRSFLALAGGAVLLAACGGDDSGGNSSVDAQGPTTTSDPNALTPGLLSSDLYAATHPQRLAFVLFTPQRASASGPPATLAITPPGGTAGAPVPAKLHTEGLPDKRGVYVVEPTLERAGIYKGTIEVDGQRLDLPFQVAAKPQAPAIGTNAPTAASPTTAKTLGVHPLCTRDPQCPLHQTSLADVVGKGRPVAVMFATPALCQTQYCGPVLDTLLPLTRDYGDRVDFVHVEIYKDGTATTLVPTVETWNLSSEPWLFGIDANGKITARLDSAFARDEIRTVLDGLVA